MKITDHIQIQLRTLILVLNIRTYAGILGALLVIATELRFVSAEMCRPANIECKTLNSLMCCIEKSRKVVYDNVVQKHI